MSDSKVPFNIFLLLPTAEDFKMLRPVKSLDIFEGGTKDFHQEGLFSTEIFGKIGDKQRSAKYSYIDFKVPVFHPILYNTLGKLKRMYLEIITGKTHAVFDPDLKDFVKSNQLDGQTGFHFFEANWRKIVFQANASDTRTQNIALINKFKSNAMCSLLVVMPAGLRDYEINENGQEEEEEINVLYRRMLSLANSISVNSFKISPEIYNQSRVNVQFTFNDIYDLILNSIKGKKKLYMGKWATRAIHDTTRNVITTTNVVIKRLGDTNNPGFNNTIVGLYQTVKGLAPIVRYRVREFLRENFNDPKLPVTVVDTKTLLSKQISITPKEYDLWMSEEGIDKILNAFAVEAMRNLPIYVGGEYLGLIYQDEQVFRVVRSIDEVPEAFDRSKVRPLRMSDIFYMVLWRDVGTFPILNTRYPITGFGSIYPSLPYLKTTIDATALYQLDADWNVTNDICPEFPGTGKWFNAMSPAPSKLDNAGADFDGDKMSLIFLYTEESRKEIKDKFLNSNFYVGTDGAMAFSIETDTSKFMVNNLTSDI